MEKQVSGITAVLVGLCLIVGACLVPCPSGAVTLEVLNPRGEIKELPSLAPAPRIADLAGKKIGIYWLGKAGGNNFWDEVEVLLKAKFPATQFVRYNGPFDLGADMAGKIAKECDAFMYGVGD